MKYSNFALVDCNNFYASCEQIFQPRLRKRPVVVLGNNDGIVVARSAEAKELGVAMGQPYFEIRRAYEQAGGIACSANYALYGDLSNRVMKTLRQFTDQVEVYSIDEAFLGLTDPPQALPDIAREIHRLVKKWTGLPISIGISPTKTLAKVANKIAKKSTGQCCLFDLSARTRALTQTAVEDIWGIGPQYHKFLATHQINNAYQLAQTDDKWIRHTMTVMAQRTVLELRGISCLALNTEPTPPKTIHRSRQFGLPVVDFEALCQPLATYVASAASELRRQHCVSGALQVHLATSPRDDHPYQNTIYQLLPWPTAATGELIQSACKNLAQIYQPDYAYRRCGVILSEIAPENVLQTNLFTDQYYDNKKRTLMHTIDQLNTEWGRGALRHAREGLEQNWHMRQIWRSQRYTTRWDELPVAV